MKHKLEVIDESLIDCDNCLLGNNPEQLIALAGHLLNLSQPGNGRSHPGTTQVFEAQLYEDRLRAIAAFDATPCPGRIRSKIMSLQADTFRNPQGFGVRLDPAKDPKPGLELIVKDGLVELRPIENPSTITTEITETCGRGPTLDQLGRLGLTENRLDLFMNGAHR